MNLPLSGRRDGFTLLELIVSMMLLSVVAVSIGTATAKLALTTTRGMRIVSALDVADDQLRAIQSDPSYASIESRYNGTDSTLAGLPGLTRTTVITHVNDLQPDHRVLDYTVAVVSISGTGLLEPVIRIVTIGAP